MTRSEQNFGIKLIAVINGFADLLHALFGIMACFLPIREELALVKFQALSQEIYQLIRERHVK